MTSPTDTPNRIDLPTLEAVIGTLREITGESVNMSDVFEVVDVSGPPTDDMRLWHDAALHSLLEPDAHGRLDPASLGESLRFEPSLGWVGEEDS
ncbi:MAG: hypothetical protein WD273_08460 [Trueperaceae bacterium]